MCNRVQANKSRDLVDANLVVYSVTDRLSFQYAQSCLQELRPAKRHNVVILVANKQDIVRNRIISEEGKLRVINGGGIESVDDLLSAHKVTSPRRHSAGL